VVNFIRVELGEELNTCVFDNFLLVTYELNLM
jgi:hypothetical protein